MKFETLKSFNKKKVIIPTVIISCLIIVITIFVSHAKFISKDSITIMDDEVNYKPYDFKIIGIYQQIDSCVGYNCYEEKEVMPSEGYEINQEKSYCYVDDENQKITGKVYTNEDGEVVIKELPKRSKCFLYFDKVKTASEKTLDQLAKLTSELTNQGVIDKEGIWGTSCQNGTNDKHINQAGIQGNCDVEENGIYETEDNDGISYYFRGTVENNYVKFGKTGTNLNSGTDIWWRIIRINGDGSIRMIYAGTGSEVPNQKTSATNITVDGENEFYYSTASGTKNNNMYVGYQYTSGVRNGHKTNSYVKTMVDKWFEAYLSDEFRENTKIDTNAGFCGDRSAYDWDTLEPNNELGTGVQKTRYGSNIRNLPNGSLPNKSNPAKVTLKCKDDNNDLLTYKNSNKGTQSLDYPIGLITADEVVYAGGLYGQSNSNYYLYNNSSYWTMSPFGFWDTSAIVGGVVGGILNGFFVYTSRGLRPVINLSSGSIISGKGTAENPFKTVNE